MCNRGLNVVSACAICGCEKENALHVFYACDFSRKVWALLTLELLSKNIFYEKIFWKHALYICLVNWR